MSGSVPVVAMCSSISGCDERKSARRADSKRRTSPTAMASSESVHAGVDDEDLLLDGHRLVVALLQQLDQSVAAVELGLGGLVELGAERRERLEVAELGEVDLQRADDRLHGLHLGRAADARDRVPDVHRRAHPRVEKVGLEEDLAVGDRDDVRRDVGRDVARLRLDDRQCRQRSAAELVRELRGAFQQAAVEVEDVARIGLTPRRAAEQQRELTVGLGLFGEVVVDDQRVLAALHPVLSHRAAGVRREVLERRRLGGRRGDDDRVLECVVRRRGSRRSARPSIPSVRSRRRCISLPWPRWLMIVSTAIVVLPVLRSPMMSSRWPRPIGVIGVDDLDAGLQGLAHRLAAHDPGGLHLEAAQLDVAERALAVDRLAEGVDDAAEQRVSDGDREDPSRSCARSDPRRALRPRRERSSRSLPRRG